MVQEEMSQASPLSTPVWVPAHLAWQMMSLLSFRKECMMGKEFAGLWQLEREAEEEEGVWVVSGISSGVGTWAPSQEPRQSIPRAGEMKAMARVNAQHSFLKHLCLDSLCLWGRVPAASPLLSAQTV